MAPSVVRMESARQALHHCGMPTIAAGCGGAGFGRNRYGKARDAGSGALLDAVGNSGTIVVVDEKRKQRIDHVVV